MSTAIVTLPSLSTQNSSKRSGNSAEDRYLSGKNLKLETSDGPSMEKLFKDTNPYLFRILSKNRIFSEEAEDLTQQTWEQFFLSRKNFQGRSALRTFICGILINKIHEFRRRRKKYLYLNKIEALETLAICYQGLGQHDSSDPFRAFESQQIRTKIETALLKLTADQRAVFLMFEVYGKRIHDICQSLQITIENFRVLLFRAKKKLVQSLKNISNVDIVK
jgi:RNA polymerase sigma-70 factor, ECF subfamily